MKNNIYTLILLLTCALFVACKKDKIEYKGDFQRSYNTWMNFKDATGNSYRYKTTFGSWTGYGTEMTVTVKAGKIVHRSYVAKHYDNRGSQPPQIVIDKTWDEDETTLNTHTGVSKSMTLDEIYEKAQQEWLIKRSDAKVYFETNNSGMISNCGYVPDACVDDCFNGISITLIEKI
ncbi:hypothetical protein HHL17_06255 [Chitinophaga sp. G-6-1-13]|uniref:Lipoprotein n=1 Tax=Chitinophaga fulva TaxID=2728842 RepID=A0A848GDQ2_9BACT|nr:hypothetical protein [Chitinophaga fulva]NML36795.1 hypothetical protein [Chitinophaga fulva]